ASTGPLATVSESWPPPQCARSDVGIVRSAVSARIVIGRLKLFLITSFFSVALLQCCLLANRCVTPQHRASQLWDVCLKGSGHRFFRSILPGQNSARGSCPVKPLFMDRTQY